MSINQEYYGFTPNKYATADASGGGVGSAGDPWTLAEAMTSAVAGDIVGIAPGVYVGISTDTRYLSAFRPSNSGTSGNPIRFVAQWAASAHTSNLTDIRCGNTNNSSTEIIEYAVTVASRAGGSGNAFYIDGSESPSLTLIRGNTYRFLQSDGTNTNHPFKLSTVDDGTHSTGSEYTNGVTEVGIPGSSDTYLQYVVPYNAPEELYYFCDNHSGMGNSITIPSNQGCSAFGTWQQDYIEWVGILSDHNDSNNWVHAPNSCVGVWSGDYVKVYGCKLIGNASQPVSDNYCGIRHETGDYCEMYNNIISGFSGSNAPSTSNVNKSGFITYKNQFTKIYNNDIFDCGHAIQPKGSSTLPIIGLEIYKNKVYNCDHFIRQHSPTKGPLGELNKVYQNIVYDCTNIFEFTTSEGVIQSNGMRIFNNVFYNTSSYKGVAWTAGDWRVAGELPRDNEFFNNIVSSDTESTTYLGADNTISDLAYYTDFINPDRNVVHNVGQIINAENGANLDSTTWLDWQNAGADVNSIQSDPLFTSAATQDFTLTGSSPALTLGRDREGQFGTVDAIISAGVYVTGNEVIGVGTVHTQGTSQAITGLSITGAGRLGFYIDYSELSASGTHRFYVTRTHGTTGTVSCTLTTSGDIHATGTANLTWADGEADVKYIDVPVTSGNLSTHEGNGLGDHRVVATLSSATGSAAIHNGDGTTRAYGVINTGAVASDANAVFYDSTAGTGTGTANDPYGSIYTAIANVGSKRYIYGKGTTIPDGTDETNAGGDGSCWGIELPATRSSEANRLVIQNWPNHTWTVTGNGGTRHKGFYSEGTKNYQTLRGITFDDLDCSGRSSSAIASALYLGNTSDCSFISVERCTSADINGPGLAAMVFAQNAKNLKIWACTSDTVSKNGSITNIDANAIGLFYSCENVSIQRCEGSNAAALARDKRPNSGTAPAMSMRFCTNGGSMLYLASYHAGESNAATYKWSTVQGNLIKGEVPTGNPSSTGNLIGIFTGESTEPTNENHHWSNNTFYYSGSGEKGAIDTKFSDHIIYNNLYYKPRVTIHDRKSGNNFLYLDYEQSYDPSYVDTIWNANSGTEYVSWAEGPQSQGFALNVSENDPNFVDTTDFVPQNSDALTGGVGGTERGYRLTGVEMIGPVGLQTTEIPSLSTTINWDTLDKDFSGLTDGQNIGRFSSDPNVQNPITPDNKKFDLWGEKGRGTLAGYGTEGDTTITRGGTRDSSARLAIAQGWDGLGAEGPYWSWAAGPDQRPDTGQVGGILSFSEPLGKGQTMHCGMWIYVPTDYDFRTFAGFLKMLRFSRSDDGGAGKMEIQPVSGTNSDGSQSGWNLQDENYQPDSQTDTLRDSSRVLIRGQWNFIAFSAYLSDVSSELRKRLWVNDELAYEQIGETDGTITVNHYNNGWLTHNFDAATSNGDFRTLNSATDTVTSMMLYTYWNGGTDSPGNYPVTKGTYPTQDQAANIDSLVVHSNEADLGTDASGNKYIASSDVYPVEAPAAPPLNVNDDFESYSLGSSPTGTTDIATWNTSSSRIEVSNVVANGGTKSLRFRYGPDASGSDSSAEQAITLDGAGYMELWLEWDMYTPTNFTHRDDPPSPNNKIIYLHNDYSEENGGIEYWPDRTPAALGQPANGKSYPTHVYRTSSSTPFGHYPSPNFGNIVFDPAEAGTWSHFKLHYKKSDAGQSNASVQFYKNDVLLIDRDNFDDYNPSRGIKPITGMKLMGWSNSGYLSETDFYWDNLYISDTGFTTPTNVTATNFVIPTATFQVQSLYRQLTSPLYDGNYPTGPRP